MTFIAHEDWELHQVDVVGAYLQGDLEEEIFMEVPEGIVKSGAARGSEGRYWKLLKPLYGLRQSGHNWKKKLKAVLTELGFEKAWADENLWILHESGRIVLLVLVYVDDMGVGGKTTVKVEWFKARMAENFDITDLGELAYILGIQVTQDRDRRTITLSQSTYVRDVLARFGMENSHAVSTPLVSNKPLSIADVPVTDEEKCAYLQYAHGLIYLEVVGAALYTAQTQPDIQHTVCVLTQYGSNSGIPHLEALKRALRYLKGTADMTLTLGGTEDFALVGWTNSDWGFDVDSRRSTTGYVFKLAGGCVSWASKKQPTVTLSTVEAEYMVSTNAVKEAVWL